MVPCCYSDGGDSVNIKKMLPKVEEIQKIKIRSFIESPFNKGSDQYMSDLLYAVTVATKMDILLKSL